MLSSFETVTIYRHQCPPKSWQWLQSKFPADLPVIKLFVGSQLHKDFCSEAFRELKELSAWPEFHGLPLEIILKKVQPQA